MLLDRIAELLNQYDADASVFSEIKALWEKHPRLQFPEDYKPNYMEF